eukprot:g1436.t1
MAENALQNVETIFETGGIVLGGSAGFAGAVAQRKHKRKVHPEGETLTSDQLMEEKLEEELQIGDIETRDDDTSIKVETSSSMRKMEQTRKANKPRRMSSIARSRVRSLGIALHSTEEKYSRIILYLSAVNGFLGLLFYFLDVISDGNLAASLYKSNMLFEFAYMVFFMALQYIVAAIGIVLYLRSDIELQDKEYKMVRTVGVGLAPVCVVIFDIFLPFYKPFSFLLNSKFINFMVQYEALHTLAEVLLESIPQSIIQITLWARCGNGSCQIDDLSGESDFLLFQLSAYDSLVFSLLVSLLSILRVAVAAFLSMHYMQVGCCEYFLHLITLGRGLPLNAMIEDQCKKCEIDYHLSKYSVSLLSKALKHNSSLQELSIRGADLGATAAIELGKGLSKCKELRILSISVNDIGDEGLIGLCKGLKYCANLEELWVSHNQIGDIGALALGITLGKGCKKIRSLNLNNNNITHKGLLSLAVEMKPCTNLSFLYAMSNKVHVDDEDEQEVLKMKIKNEILPSCKTIIV